MIIALEWEGCDKLSQGDLIPGKTIRKLRLQKNMSQELLSGLAGISRTHLTMIECGKKQPNLQTIWKIALGLGMLPSEIVAEFEKESHLSEVDVSNNEKIEL